MAGGHPFEGHEANTRASGKAVLLQVWGSAILRRLDLENGNGLSVAESECVSARIDAHPRTTHQVQASPVRRPKSRAGCVSMDRWDARTRDTSPRSPSAHPRPASRNQPATAPRRRPGPIAGRAPAEEPSRVLRSQVERVE